MKNSILTTFFFATALFACLTMATCSRLTPLALEFRDASEAMSGPGFEITGNSGLTVITSETGTDQQIALKIKTKPQSYVLISVSSSNATEGTVSPATLVFDASNYQVPQMLTITGLDDLIKDGNQPYKISVSPAQSADPKYNGYTIPPIQAINTDNEVAGITVTPLSSLSTSENGQAALFQIVLNSEPTADTTISIFSSNENEGRLNASGGVCDASGNNISGTCTLTFTAANWSKPRVVRVAGIADHLADGNQMYDIIIASTITTTDALYYLLFPLNVSITNNDIDSIGINVSPVTGLITSEGGAAAQFSISMNTQPSADVLIGISSSNAVEGQVNQTDGTCDQVGIVSATSCNVVFTSANWNIPRIIRIAGVDDAVTDGNISYNIVTSKTVSADSNYNNLNIPDVAVVNMDNDTPGVTISAISGNTGEAGIAATFTVRLNSQPTANVTIPLSSSNTAEGQINQTSGSCNPLQPAAAVGCNLTFSAVTWSTPQVVKITGQDDFVVDGNIAYNIITGAAVSADVNYSGIIIPDIAVINIDNDVPAVIASAISANTMEAGGTATFSVVLSSQPLSNVVMAVSSSNVTEGKISSSNGTNCDNTVTLDADNNCNIVFTALNWNTPQIIRVTGMDDFVIDGNVSYQINISNAVSADPLYSNKVPTPAAVSILNIDNDTAGIVVTPTSGLLTSETGTSSSFTVVLTAQPASNVVITLSSNNEAEGRLNATGGDCDNSSTTITGNCTLTFTSGACPATGNWCTNRVVKVTGIDDAFPDSRLAYSIMTAAAVTSDINFNGLNPQDVSLINIDDENYRRIFVTAAAYDGNLGGVSGADAKCTADANKPTTSAYKAFIVIGNTRRATLTSNVGDGQIDWVLSGKDYYRAADAAYVGTPGINNLFTFPLSSSLNPTATAWMPFSTNWHNYDTLGGPKNNCLDYATNSNNFSVTIGSFNGGGSGLDYTGNIVGNDTACNLFHRLVCVEQ